MPDMNAAEKNGVNGMIRVHESVLASIVEKSTFSISGVVRLAGNSFVDNIAEIVGTRRSFDRSVAIDMSGDVIQRIEVRVVAAFGAFLPEVARNIQQTIWDNVTKMTGMPVKRLDVVIMDVDDPEKTQSEPRKQ